MSSKFHANITSQRIRISMHISTITSTTNTSTTKIRSIERRRRREVILALDCNKSVAVELPHSTVCVDFKSYIVFVKFILV